MTNKKHDPREELLRLADSLVEDILNTDDETILAEAIEDNVNIDKVVERNFQLIENAIVQGGKERMAIAKKGVQRSKLKPLGKIKLFPTERKHEIIRQVSRQRSGQFTMAARKEDELTEGDIDSMLEVMLELGIITDEGELS